MSSYSGLPDHSSLSSALYRSSAVALFADHRDINESRNMILSREAAKAFFEADVDGNSELSYDEFCTLATNSSTRRGGPLTDREMLKLFKTVDTNHDGVISMQEFFLWVLSTIVAGFGGCASAGFGSMEAIFRRYCRSFTAASPPGVLPPKPSWTSPHTPLRLAGTMPQATARSMQRSWLVPPRTSASQPLRATCSASWTPTAQAQSTIES